MTIYKEEFNVAARDFIAAGEASGKIKRQMKRLGVDMNIVRRISIASYEAEINLVIHAFGGKMELGVDENEVRIIVTDTGPGIPDIDLAMREGYSTATDDVRMMGFGAGMGLSNMARNADAFHIESEVGVGTRVEMVFRL